MTFARRAGLAALVVAAVASFVAVVVDLTGGPENGTLIPVISIPIVVIMGAAGLVAATADITRATRDAGGQSVDAAGERDARVRTGLRDSVLCACTVLAAPFVLLMVSATLSG